MKTQILILVLLVSASILSMPATATPSGTSGGDSHPGGQMEECYSQEGPALSQLIGPGVIVGCINYPERVYGNAASFRVDASFHGPPIGATATVQTSLIQTQTGNVYSGCSSDSSSGSLQDTGLVTSTWMISRSISQRVLMSNPECSGVVRITVAVAPLTGAAVTIFDHLFSFNVISVQYEQYNFMALCDNSVTPVTGGFSNCPELTVEICPESGPCFLDICPEESPCFIESNSTLSINGNVIINQTNLPPVPEEGAVASLYVLMLFVALVLAHLGEKTNRTGYVMFSGILFLVVGFVSIWEQSKLGFDQVPGLLIPMLGFMLMVGGYLIFRAVSTNFGGKNE